MFFVSHIAGHDVLLSSPVIVAFSRVPPSVQSAPRPFSSTLQRASHVRAADVHRACIFNNTGAWALHVLCFQMGRDFSFVMRCVRKSRNEPIRGCGEVVRLRPSPLHFHGVQRVESDIQSLCCCSLNVRRKPNSRGILKIDLALCDPRPPQTLRENLRRSLSLAFPAHLYQSCLCLCSVCLKGCCPITSPDEVTIHSYLTTKAFQITIKHVKFIFVIS